jgi:hypothetical protein
VDTLRAQPWPHWQAWIVGADPVVTDAAALMAAADPRVRGVAGWADLAPDDDAAPWWLLLEAGERLDPMALPWLVHAARQSPQAAAFYWDEDTLRHAGGRAPAREERHVRPLLRRAFDRRRCWSSTSSGAAWPCGPRPCRRWRRPWPRPMRPCRPPGGAEALVWALAGQGRWCMCRSSC